MEATIISIKLMKTLLFFLLMDKVLFLLKEPLIKKVDEFNLPVAEGFWNCQGLLVGGKIYSLQNVE